MLNFDQIFMNGTISQIVLSKNGSPMANITGNNATVNWTTNTTFSAGSNIITAITSDSYGFSVTNSLRVIAVDLNAGLVSHLTLDGTYTDTGSSPKTWSILGSPAPTFVAGNSGNALAFAANATSYARASAEFFFGTNSFVLSLWVKSSVSGWQRRLLGADLYTSAYTGINQAYAWLCFNNGRIAYEAVDDTSKSWIVTSPSTYNNGAWHHVVVSIDRRYGLSTMYVDGTKVAEVSQVSTGRFGFTGGVNMFCINGQYGVANMFGDGTYDGVRIYNGRALDIYEVQLLRAVGN